MSKFGVLGALGLRIVNHQEALVMERFGKFSEVLTPGWYFRVPLINREAARQFLKEKVLEIMDQSVVTSDNVALHIGGVLYVRVYDPYAATYGVEDIQRAIEQLAQTTMRSEIGKIALDNVFKEREILNYNIVEGISKATKPWGTECLRYEIKNIKIPEKIQIAMQMQVEAERKKRAAILESEGLKTAKINEAEAHKQSAVLASEGLKIEQINHAAGEADAMLALARAKAQSIELVGKAISSENGENAVKLRVAENYIHEFGKLAKENNTVVLSSPVGDISSMVAQAMAIYNNTKRKDENKELSD